jgi:ADP-ribosylglycohydrolase
MGYIVGKNIWLDGMMGLVVGDALGVPVQFLTREEIWNRECGPVTGMESGGVYDMPEGTWSDDSSMALATLASLLDKRKVDLGDIMMRFVKWEIKGEYTPFGEAFDEGNTCSDAIYKFIAHPDVNTCGKTGEHANGNGALMRILPACLYYYERQKKVCTSEDEAIYGIHAISGLTHNHLRGQMCCGIYYFMAKHILDNGGKSRSLQQLLQEGINEGLKFYGRDIRNLTEMAYLGRLFDLNELKDTSEEKIIPSGYVVESLEAAVWCLITTNSLKDCLLKAVNLGDDTDTVAAIAGGLAGLYYGYEAIPKEWLAVIKRREWIEDLCEKMNLESN